MERSQLKRATIVGGTVALASAAAYTFVVRKWHNRWGATDKELALPLPGDEVVVNADTTSTRAITIMASPDDIWPWLVQMGKGRGGLYSYDWLDIAFGYLDNPSSDRILPEFQRLEAGDVVPIGRDDTTMDDFYVHTAEPGRALVLGVNDPAYRGTFSWAIVLLPQGPNITRLVTRVRGKIEKSPKGILMYALLDPAAFIMVRKQMLNIKKLAEATRARRQRLNLRTRQSSPTSGTSALARSRSQ